VKKQTIILNRIRATTASTILAINRRIAFWRPIKVRNL
jgi:hypothetical protein